MRSVWRIVPLDEQAAAMAATFLHDTIAVGVAGKATPVARIVKQAVAAQTAGADHKMHVLGEGMQPLAVGQAAFINAFQIHCQEFDAVHEPAVVHPMATVVSALLAEAGRGAPVSGEQFSDRDSRGC